MVDGQVCPKGVRQVLEERGVNTAGMKGEKLRKTIESHSNFWYEKTKVEQHLEKEKGHRVLFFPKTIVNSTLSKGWGQEIHQGQVWLFFYTIGMYSKSSTQCRHDSNDYKVLPQGKRLHGTLQGGEAMWPWTF